MSVSGTPSPHRHLRVQRSNPESLSFRGGILDCFAAVAQTAPPQEGPITCASPVAPDDTERSLKQRFGKDAVVQDLPCAEGEKYKGVVLFPTARDRRIEIAFTDDKAMRASGLTLRDTARTSRWSINGVSIGSGLADVQKANGKPFLVSGFEWDYGGFVTDWKGGALGRPLQGGARSRSASTRRPPRRSRCWATA